METPLATLSACELLRRLDVLVRRDRAAEAVLVMHLGEVDARRLYLEQGCSSMFDYCTRVLHFAEGVAYKRIQVARAARRHPELLEAIRCGDLHVTAASLLVPQLTRDNVRELIGAARHRTTEQVRALLADRKPRPDDPTSVWRTPVATSAEAHGVPQEVAPHDAPTPSPGVETEGATEPEPEPACDLASPRAPAPASANVPSPAPPPGTPRPEPLGKGRYCIRFTADGETWRQLEELRALMRHQVPDGDVAKILSRAIAVLLKQVRQQKLGACVQPRASAPPRPHERPSRSIPAAVRREVFRRDGGRCTFVSAQGRRCGAREFLEFHHVDPWVSSRCHPLEGITLRCRAHNQLQAERDFGARHMARFRKPATERDCRTRAVPWRRRDARPPHLALAALLPVTLVTASRPAPHRGPFIHGPGARCPRAPVAARA